MRTMSRLEVVAQTLRHALNVLATTVPDWLRTHLKTWSTPPREGLFDTQGSAHPLWCVPPKYETPFRREPATYAASIAFS